MKTNENFFEKSYAVARLIPFGRVTSYGAIAKYLGADRSARMVGWAMNACGGDTTVPAHRVVNRQGIITGKHHFSGINLMQQLLESEGIVIKNDKIINFEATFWNPSKVLN